MYFKKSHQAWYVNIQGKPRRLGRTQEEAERVLNQHRDFTVSEIIDKFLSQPRAKSTQKIYSLIRDFQGKCGHLTVRDLRVYHATEWTEERNRLKALKTCFNWAEKRGYAPSPLKTLRVPATPTRSDEAYLTPDQWRKVTDAIDSQFLDFVTVLHETGCRPTEARRVEARHFDRQERCWKIPRKEAKGGIYRVVHLSDAAFAICQRLALKRPTGPLFPYTASAVCRQFERISRKIGFRVTAYSLRHTFATEAILKGVDLQTIAILMGHQDLKMLSQVYQHVRKRSDFVKDSLKKLA